MEQKFLGDYTESQKDAFRSFSFAEVEHIVNYYHQLFSELCDLSSFFVPLDYKSEFLLLKHSLAEICREVFINLDKVNKDVHSTSKIECHD